MPELDQRSIDELKKVRKDHYRLARKVDGAKGPGVICNDANRLVIGGTGVGKDSPPENAPDSIDVWVTQTGGSAGDETTQCTFTYSIFPWSDPTKAGTPLATGVAMQGNGHRIVNGLMTAGTLGRARQVSGTWKLLWVDEKFSQQNCAEA